METVTFDHDVPCTSHGDVIPAGTRCVSIAGQGIRCLKVLPVGPKPEPTPGRLSKNRKRMGRVGRSGKMR